MSNPRIHLMVICVAFALGGCSPAVEIARALWGSSTRALERSRGEAVRQTFRCSLDEAMDRVVDLSRDDLTVTPVRKRYFEIFSENRVKGIIVVMKVPGHIDTTEVGIFFVPQDDRSTLVEVASLSLNAKQVVSEIVFSALKKNYAVKNP